jgi:C_GCAxxG_C_C family probable redox protein
MQEAQDFPCITQLAAGFGGGIGSEQDVCGAITGGVIAVGYKEGLGRDNQEEIAKACRASVRDIYEGFQDKFGAVDCLTLIGYDYREPGQQEAARTDPERIAKCNGFKEWAIRRLFERED